MAHRDTPRQAQSAGQNNPIDAPMDQMAKLKASIRAKVEHPFRVIKRRLVRQGALSGLGEEHAAAQDAVPTCGWCASNC